MFYSKNDQGYKNPLPGVSFKTVSHGEKMLMTEFQLKKGYELPKHSHPHEQTGYLISGHITLMIVDEFFDTHPGDAWTIPANMEHKADILEDSAAIEVFSPLREDYL